LASVLVAPGINKRIKEKKLKASVLLAHPYEKSLNHAIYRTVCAKLQELNVEFFAHDLYLENFNPVMTRKELGTDRSEDALVNKYADELQISGLLFFIHPNWWGQPPAIMKGYIDRVIRPPYAYDFPPGDSGGGVPIGKLNGKTGIVLNTSNTEESREAEVFGDPLENIWKDCVFGFCGLERYYRKMFRVVANSDLNLRREWLKEAADITEHVVFHREGANSSKSL
jgi:NAD(P)H dehydrogenase (quinone)